MLASSPDAVGVPLHAENNPEMVHIAKGLRRRKRGNSLRAILQTWQRQCKCQWQAVFSGLGRLNAGRLGVEKGSTTLGELRSIANTALREITSRRSV
jgi:hypothetical protein